MTSSRVAGRPLFLVLALLALLRPQSLAGQERTDAYDQGIFELSARHLAPVTVLVLVDSAGRVLLPAGAALAFAGVPYSFDATTQQVLLGEGSAAATLDVGSRTLVRGTSTFPLAAGALAVIAGEVHVATDVLAELLGADVAVDWGRLQISLEARDGPLPAQRRLATERRRSVLAQRAARLHAPAVEVPYAPASGGGVVDWNLNLAPTDPLAYAAGGIRVGAAVLGGSLTLGATAWHAAGRGASVRSSGTHYLRVFPAGTRLTQLQLGSITPTSGLSHFYDGVLLSNAPYAQPTDFVSVALEPELPPGWAYEVYQSGQLLGFAEAGARSPIDVPLRYGSTPVELRLLGPAGEARTVSLSYRAPQSMVQPARWEYSVGGGACASGRCDRYGFGQVRRGWSRQLTTGVGGEIVHDSTGWAARPFGQVVYSSGLRTTVEAIAAPGAYARLAASWFADAHTTLTGSVDLSEPGGSSAVSWVPGEAARWTTMLRFERRSPRAAAPLRSLRLEARLTGSDEYGRERGYLAVGGQLRGSFLEFAYEMPTAWDAEYVRGRVHAPLWPGRRGTSGLSLTTGVAVGGSGVCHLEGGLAAQVARATTLNASAQWSAGARRPGLQLTVFRRLGLAQAFGRVSAAPQGGTSSSLALSGGFAAAPHGGVMPFSDSRAGWAGVAGTVFYDTNGNGRLDPGEAPAESVYVHVGGHYLPTDATGRFRSWSVSPYEVVRFGVDSLRVPDPSWTTAAAAVHVRPVPNLFSRVDIPLIRTRELFGTLAPGAGIGTAAGVTLEITRVGSTDTLRTQTFSNGDFYISRMRPGEYSLRVAASSLAVLRAQSTPESVHFTIPAAGDEPVVELPAIELIREGGSPRRLGVEQPQPLPPLP